MVEKWHAHLYLNKWFVIYWTCTQPSFKDSFLPWIPCPLTNTQHFLPLCIKASGVNTGAMARVEGGVQPPRAGVT